MVSKSHSIRRQVLCAASLIGLAVAQQAAAQEAPPQPEETAKGSEIVVTGSRIAGSKITEALPVTVVSEEEIAATAAVSGDDLIRSIPQMSDVSFNTSNGQTSSNFARGDVGSIDLRGLGVGNTLVLLNGRRVVQHPSSQASASLAPVTTYNTNAIPVFGVKRVEVLRDGAAALYGTDAVAGVVNTVLRDNINGGSLSLQYGGAEGTGLREFNASGYLGSDFSNGRGNFSVLFNYTNRTALTSQDLPFTATSDHRAFAEFAGTIFAGSNSLDDTSTLAHWGNFATVGGVRVRRGTTNVTTAGGVFSIQPTANGGCSYDLGTGICIDDGNRATTGADRNTRWDGQANFPISISPSLDRINLYASGHYDLTDDVTMFTELGYYYGKTKSIQDSVFSIGSIQMTIPASNYWNPFGPVTFANGSANPNRLAGIDAPVAGLPIFMSSYRFVDMGPTVVDVTNRQFRAVLGLRGEALGFKWETAGVYSEASVNDVQDGISSTLLQKNLALSTPDAYNPFNGGSATNPTGPDTSVSSQAALDAIRIKTTRKGKSTLAEWDFRASRPDLFSLPGGDVGMAFGAEIRRDTQLDDRDPRVDGTIKWTDTVTGVVQDSDLFGVSPTPDTRGARTVFAAYSELAIPVISPEMDVPLIRSLTLQAAGRYEHYSDFGSIAKPKVAAAWDVVEGLRLRGSWAQGFRAPNLEQTNATIVTRGNTRTDYIRCEADLRAGRIANFSSCGQAFVTTARRAGNPNLEPETSETWTFGTVLQPSFLNTGKLRTTFTADFWQVKQKGIVGVYGEGNALINDYLQRVQGSNDPNVTRAAPTADDIALFAGTGLTPVGRVTYVDDLYRNLEPQTVRGLDFGLNIGLRDTGIGNFTLSANVAYLLKYYRDASPDIQVLIDARAAGTINQDTIIPEGGDLVRNDGFPKWRASGSLTWKLGQFTTGVFVSHRGSVIDDDISVSGQNWTVKSYTTANLYVQYDLMGGIADRTTIRLGVRNIANSRPPIDSGSFGYMGSLDSPNPRYWYASIRKDF
ncbi:TonB-dependent receptor domain-containing protein [Novosphingobium sp.]|uniref:TonB-dependent receptor domain-containing protein n=1 Tax=Novosphingobium sp. TaxID=1874826 RepID=UPI002732959F|nr:TonB-dependent receptor [Novosphingobium sp.]MDP3908240.1 TonB-dependent receptor [Novosphingobium sp.]